MASRVFAWKDALANGLSPGLYSYSDVPLGEYDAILDFKIWAKKLMAINCYFTQVVTGKKILLTVFCNEGGLYKVGGSAINFATCDIERVYKINVMANQNKRIVFAHVVLDE